jgi:hypothetical protein
MPSPEKQSPSGYAIVSHNVAPMWSEPEGGSEQVSQALFGERVRMLGEEGGLTQVQTPDGYCGWARREHLTPCSEETRYPAPGREARVEALFLPVLNAPDDRAERRTLLTFGCCVELDDLSDGAYAPIRLPDGQIAYARRDGLQVGTEREPPSLIETARRFLGVPYLWGGRSPFGIDCSGFTQRVYERCGCLLPRDAYLQAREGILHPVESERLLAGDLVFFCSDRDPRGRGITHVGIALGDGRFIHASASRGVAVTPLTQPPYDQQFRCARRLRTAYVGMPKTDSAGRN